MTDYYVAAVCAFRKIDGDAEHVQISMHAAVIHPESGVDPELLAISAARVDILPESEGWYDHHAVVAPIDIMVMATIEAEKTAAPNELRIVRFPVEVATNEETA